MVNLFRPVPDWFSFENQGGGIAVGSLANDGTQDMVVLMVDNPVGQNQGLYRVGKTLDDAGRITGGWTPWITIPDWFSWENQGGNIALADLDDSGRQDLVVAMVDNPIEQNQGLFRIGRNLDASGNVTGGWTPWITIPDWFSWENQGIAVAVTPPNNQGKRDLIVLTIDNPPQGNRAIYRIGKNIDINGNVTGWSPWIDVPGWFSWENQGCGIAVADLDEDGNQDLIIFSIDNPIGQNQAFYRIGKNLGNDGISADGWGPWLGVPNWFSFENQGGGIAVAKTNNKHRLFAFMVDNSPQQNAGLYEIIDLDHDPEREGSWDVLNFHSGVLAVHAALLPKGKVLFFAGSGSSATRFNSPIFGDESKGIFTSVVWSPPHNTFSHPPTLRTANHKPFDFFCGGDAFLPDGRLLSAGGTIDYNPFRGRKDAAIFDFTTEKWSVAGNMAQGRWYPTLIALGDGKILAASGLGDNGGDLPKTSLEIYSAATDTWHIRHFADGFPGLPLYAHLFLLASGKIFFSGGRMDDPLQVDPCIIDLTHDPVTTKQVRDLLAPDMRNQSASVILPPAQDQRIMIIGGGPVGKPDKTDATDAVSIVDLKAADPIYHAGAPIGLPRLHLNTVLLPDRTVFVSGGSLKQEDEPLARLQGEIYDPATNTWSLMAAATVQRLYHSTALLLPDGRVVAAGGNPEGGHQISWEPPDPEEEMRVEVFSPPYLFKGPRPVIGTAQEEWSYGQTVTITTAQANTIRWASLIKNCVTTHSFDSGQRLVDLQIVSRENDSLDVTITSNPNIAPPGWYMLFIVDQQGVPSIATWIHLT
ncbi:galactose oxidase early set domain-containing protein [Frankia sp. CiP3]|uniref:galactose oxidase early set domain-containing protein n=1 Tax=Frankia sp. CiP3 TaxID=2880971 RepID=UPI001EF701E1|nr:galactose oxidase early set domain-containing protein [Frankia sp. CiP3]